MSNSYARVPCGSSHPNVIGATPVVNVVTKPKVVEVVDVAVRGVDLRIDEYEVASSSSRIGRTPADAHVRRKSGAMVVAVKRTDENTRTSPEPTTVIAGRDAFLVTEQVGVWSRFDRIDVRA